MAMVTNGEKQFFSSLLEADRGAEAARVVIDVGKALLNDAEQSGLKVRRKAGLLKALVPRP